MLKGSSRAIVRTCRAACSLAVPLAVAAALIASCEGPPGRPTHLPYFRLAGPGEVAPGTSASFKALLDKSATLSDVTGNAQWISSNSSVLSIDAGLAAGRTAGEATVTARFQEHESDARLVMVLPRGTYRLRGKVVIATTTVPVSMARVEVPAAGLSTTADGEGRYALYGVRPDAEMRVAREGYAPVVLPIHLQDHDQEITAPLRPLLEGTYTLTISPGRCSNGPPRPAHLLQRTYTAVFVQDGLQVQGTLSGGELTVKSFSDRFLGPQSRWSLAFAVGERLSDGNVVTLNGTALIGPEDLEGDFNGRIALNNPSAQDAIARCEATAFRFALTK
jgi:hypothetical protein